MAEGQERPGTEVEKIVEAAQQRRHDGRRAFRQVVKSKVRRAFVENAALKFVAFVLALTVFILVHSDEDVYVGVNVGVSYTLPEDRVLVSEPPESARITVRGSRRKIRRFDETDLERIHIDLRNHRRSEYVFHEDLIQLPEGIELVRFAPPSFLTRFEKKLDKQVPVEVQTIGDVPPGYRMTGVAAEPATVQIAGPVSAMEAISAVRTREISLIGRSESFRNSVPVVPPDDLVKIVEPASGEVAVEIGIVEERASRRLGPLSVELRSRRGVSKEELARFEVEPAEVEVILHGSRLAVDAVDVEDLKAFIEVSADDFAAGRLGVARVIVPKPAEGIGLEVVPEEVRIQLQ